MSLINGNPDVFLRIGLANLVNGLEPVQITGFTVEVIVQRVAALTFNFGVQFLNR